MLSHRLWVSAGHLATVVGAMVAILGTQGSNVLALAPAVPAEPKSILGSYLAGKLARGQHDTSAAADYDRQALAGDPENEVLLEQAFLMEATEGRWPEAVELGRRLLARQSTHRVASLVIGVADYKALDYKSADERF